MKKSFKVFAVALAAIVMVLAGCKPQTSGDPEPQKPVKSTERIFLQYVYSFDSKNPKALNEKNVGVTLPRVVSEVQIPADTKEDDFDNAVLAAVEKTWKNVDTRLDRSQVGFVITESLNSTVAVRPDYDASRGANEIVKRRFYDYIKNNEMLPTGADLKFERDRQFSEPYVVIVEPIFLYKVMGLSFNGEPLPVLDSEQPNLPVVSYARGESDLSKLINGKTEFRAVDGCLYKPTGYVMEEEGKPGTDPVSLPADISAIKKVDRASEGFGKNDYSKLNKCYATVERIIKLGVVYENTELDIDEDSVIVKLGGTDITKTVLNKDSQVINYAGGDITVEPKKNGKLLSAQIILDGTEAGKQKSVKKVEVKKDVIKSEVKIIITARDAEDEDAGKSAIDPSYFSVAKVDLKKLKGGEDGKTRCLPNPKKVKVGEVLTPTVRPFEAKEYSATVDVSGDTSKAGNEVTVTITANAKDGYGLVAPGKAEYADKFRLKFVDWKNVPKEGVNGVKKVTVDRESVLTQKVTIVYEVQEK